MLDAGYKDAQSYRQQVLSRHQLKQEAQQLVGIIKVQAAAYRAPRQRPAMAPVENPHDYLSRETAKLKRQRGADEEALRAAVLFQRTADLQHAAAQLESSCNALLTARESDSPFLTQANMVQQLSFAMAGARAAGQSHHQAAFQLEMAQPSNEAEPLSKIWT